MSQDDDAAVSGGMGLDDVDATSLRDMGGGGVPKRRLVAIPCFNEEATVGSVVLKAQRYADEVVVIDDGSTDKTAEIAEEAGATVVRHGGNRGYGAAIQSCFRYARETDADVLTILDGDGQHDADQIHSVMRPVVEDRADVSIGSRFLDGDNKKGVPLYRRLGIWVLTRMTNAGSREEHHRVRDSQSGFRAYSRDAINRVDVKDTRMGASAEILLQGRKHGLSFMEVPISCSYDKSLDASSEGPVGHGLGVIVSILQYMEVEHSLLFFGVPGLVLFSAGLVYGFNVYLMYKAGGFLPFGPSLITVALLILGMLLGMTGLILHAVINANKRR